MLPVLKMCNVSFAYDSDGEDDPVPVLDSYNLEVYPGEAVALSGPNGSGKSTVMKIMNGLLIPSSGVYEFQGTAVTAKFLSQEIEAKEFHRKMGFIFQSSESQLFSSSVEQEIAFGPVQMGLEPEQVERRTHDILELFKLSKLAHRAPYKLSGGEKKRVAIAACMALNPEILVLDEPSDGLDEANTDFMIRFLNHFVSSGKSIVISTHHAEVIAALHARKVPMAALKTGL